MALYDTDDPALSSLKIRVFPPAAGAALPTTKTTVTRVPVRDQVLVPTDMTAGVPPGTPYFPDLFIVGYETKTTVVTTPPKPGVFGEPREYPRFLAYEYDENFLTPSDGWSFSVDGDELTDADRAALVTGARVEVQIDDRAQSIGYVDEVRVRSTRDGGTVITIEGRDWLSPAVDSHVSPDTRLDPSMSLADLLSAVFAPFGMKVAETDNAANRNAITGATRGVKTTKKGAPLKSFILHQTKPYPQEGAFEFAARVAQRFGIWLWPAADGRTVIAGKPDFTTAPSYQLLHSTDPAQAPFNNVLESDVVVSRRELPSVILASGFDGGGVFSKSSIRAGVINPLIATDVSNILAAYPEIRFLTIDPGQVPKASTQGHVYCDPNARPLFLYDAESHTQDQLESFLRRELALRMRKGLTAHYTIEGHRLGGVAIAVDTMIDVQDDRSNVHQVLWVLGRRFSKTPHGGTTTRIECIRPNTLQF